MSLMTYRKAVKADLDWLVEAEKQCFQGVDSFLRSTIAGMVRNIHHTIILDIITCDGDSAGYGAYLTRRKSTVIRLYSICVLPAYQGRGLAAQYLAERMKTFSPDYQKIGLEVRITNSRAYQLYTKAGFVVEKVLPHYYPDGEDAYRMVKTLKEFFSI